MRNIVPNGILENRPPYIALFPGAGGNPKTPCDKCGTYRFEGNSIMVKDGVRLSPSEYQVFKRVQLADKIIADQLFISVETVKKHFQNIRKKTGLNNKIEIAIWATQKGVYNGYSN